MWPYFHRESDASTSHTPPKAAMEPSTFDMATWWLSDRALYAFRMHLRSKTGNKTPRVGSRLGLFLRIIAKTSVGATLMP